MSVPHSDHVYTTETPVAIIGPTYKYIQILKKDYRIFLF